MQDSWPDIARQIMENMIDHEIPRLRNTHVQPLLRNEPALAAYLKTTGR